MKSGSDLHYETNFSPPNAPIKLSPILFNTQVEPSSLIWQLYVGNWGPQ